MHVVFTTMFMSDDWGNVTDEEYFKMKDKVADDMIRVFERKPGVRSGILLKRSVWRPRRLMHVTAGILRV